MDKRLRFFKSGIMLTLVALSMRTVSMLFSAFVTRLVGAEGIGVFTLVMTVYSFAVTFAVSGVGLTTTKLTSEAIGEGREEDIPAILRGAMLYSFVFSLLAAILLFFGADFFSERILSDQRCAPSLKILAFSLLPLSLGSTLSGYFIAVRRVGFNAASQVFGQGAKILITVIVASRLSGSDTMTAVSVMSLISVVTELLSFFLMLVEFIVERRKYEDGIRGKNKFSNVFAMAMPIALSAYARSILLNVEHILIPKKLRERGEDRGDAYAHYGVLHGMALPLVTYPMSPLSSFSGLLVPEFAEELARKNQKRLERIATKALNTTLAYASVTAVLLFTFSEELGYALYDSYDAGYYVSTLSLVVPIMYLDHVTDAMLKGLGEQVYSMWVNITDSLLSVMLVWFLIPRMGIMGYAVVILIMEAYNFALSYKKLRSVVAFRIDLVRAFLLPTLVTAAASIISKSIFRFSGSSAPMPFLVMKIIFAVAISVAGTAAFLTRWKSKRI